MPKDKIMHFVVTAAVFFCVNWLFGIFPATMACILWAFGKEFYDEYKGGQFDWLDILADFLGFLFAYMVIKA